MVVQRSRRAFAARVAALEREVVAHPCYIELLPDDQRLAVIAQEHRMRTPSSRPDIASARRARRHIALTTRIVAGWYYVDRASNQAENAPNFSSWTDDTYGFEHYYAEEDYTQINWHYDVRQNHAADIPRAGLTDTALSALACRSAEPWLRRRTTRRRRPRREPLDLGVARPRRRCVPVRLSAAAMRGGT